MKNFGRLIKFWSGVFFVIVALGAIVMILDPEEVTDASDLFLGIICGAGGVLLIRSANKTKKEQTLFRSYVAAISNEPNGYIPNIAASLGKSEDAVIADMALLIDKKYFANAYIDKQCNCIIIGNRRPTVNPQQTSTQASQQPNSPQPVKKPVEMLTIKCSGCGGINTIAKGEVGECDYCGSAIKGE